MFEKILVSMALSPATESLVAALPGMRDFGASKIALVHVAKPTRGPTSQALSHVEQLRSRLNGLADRLTEAGFTVTVRVPTGDSAGEVVRAAEEWEPDVILLGSRSRSLIQDAFIGSVAWDIIRNAGRPVFLQRIEPNRSDPEAALENRGVGLPKHVVFPTDFSETAERAWPWLVDLAKEGGPSFTLLHVMPAEEGRKEAERRLDKFAQELRDQGASDVECRARVGTPYEEILNAGGNRTDALVVMGTRGRGVLQGAVLGSVGRQILRQAASRVLLVPPGA